MIFWNAIGLHYDTSSCDILVSQSLVCILTFNIVSFFAQKFWCLLFECEN